MSERGLTQWLEVVISGSVVSAACVSAAAVHILNKVILFVGHPANYLTRQSNDEVIRGVDPYGTGGTRPPNIWTGGTLPRMPPPQYF